MDVFISGSELGRRGWLIYLPSFATLEGANFSKFMVTAQPMSFCLHLPVLARASGPGWCGTGERPEGAKPALSWAEGNLDWGAAWRFGARFLVASLLGMTHSREG
jgi:hypothetical protein